ncbi:protein ABHD18-like [Rhopilema esculentum]|uniref:protein ABHD18-like n=1 Tax=Rhopilema esculentum TaxID=499914 RepID=UPI0031D38583|eukprot:gene8835-15320_t
MAVANSGSRVDTIYRAAIQAPKFFSKGLGDIRLLERIFKLMNSVRHERYTAWENGDGSVIDQCFNICRRSDIKILGSGKNGIADVFEYEFKSPLTKILPGALPKESERVRFQLVLPTSWNRNGEKSSSKVPERKPLCIHLAGTGDHYYWRRRHFMALPLVKENDVASIILENPFYGTRKPKGQNKSGLRYVCDLFVMGAALKFEVMALLAWCEKQGYGPLGVTGISMGGHMASISATSWNKPIGIIPCLSWSTAAPVFTQGVMKYSVSWDVLQEQLKSTPEYVDLLEKYSKEYCEKLNSRSKSLSGIGKFPKHMEASGKEDLLKIVGERNTKRADKFRNYDVDKKKLGIFAVDFDSLLRLDNLTSGLVHSISEKLNFDLLRQYSLIDSGNTNEVNQDTIDYMDSIFHELTHLEKFTPPHPESCMIFVTANHDSYVPMNNFRSPAEVWPNAEMRSIDCGHVMGVLRYQKMFRDAIRDALSRL